MRNEMHWGSEPEATGMPAMPEQVDTSEGSCGENPSSAFRSDPWHGPIDQRGGGPKFAGRGGRCGLPVKPVHKSGKVEVRT